MANQAGIEIRCERCKAWFKSGILIANGDSFDNTILIGNKIRCPACQSMTGCNKENMRASFSDGGGFSGNGTT